MTVENKIHLTTISPALHFAFRLKTSIESYSPATSSIEPLRTLLDIGAQNEYEWYQDAQGRSALHHAAELGHLAIVELLVRAGHPWHAKDDAGVTAAELARMKGYEDVYGFLLEEGVRSEMILGAAGRQSKRSMQRLGQDGRRGREAEEGGPSELMLAEDASNKVDEVMPHGQDDRHPKPQDNDEAERYLDRKVAYSGQGALVDEGMNAVMMEWERPLMKRHAQIVCQMAGPETLDESLRDSDDTLRLDAFDFSSVPDRQALCLDHQPSNTLKEVNGPTTKEGMRHFAVLNVGFGMGIIDSYIHRYLALKMQQDPSVICHHYIIEAHPTVLAAMVEKGWTSSEDVADNIPRSPVLHILEGPWQEQVEVLMDQGVELDGIFFDTFGEDYEALREFQDMVLCLLKPSTCSVYTFFNGLGATNAFIHDVYLRICDLELTSMHMSVEWETMPVRLEKETYNGMKRPYFVLDTYHLPICRHASVE